MRAFISHISEEAETATKIKESLDRDFLGNLEVFVSSDSQSIAAGEDWLKSVEIALRNTNLLIVLCSPVSIRRPWINFESGAAWILDVPIIPLCHMSFTPRDLPMPLSLRQGLLITDSENLRRLYERIADVLSCHIPNISFDKLAEGFTEMSLIAESSVLENDLRELEDDRGIRKRLNEALNNPDFKWRSLERLAVEAGVSPEIAADVLRADDKIRFSEGKDKIIIVGLRSRVG